MWPPRTVIKVLLILGLTSLCAARPLTKKEELKIIKLQPKMKIPKIDEFVEGNVSKKGPLFTYTYKYKNYKENKTCAVVFKQLYSDDYINSSHKWKCTEYPDVPDLKDLVGPDYGSSTE